VEVGRWGGGGWVGGGGDSEGGGGGSGGGGLSCGGGGGVWGGLWVGGGGGGGGVPFPNSVAGRTAVPPTKGTLTPGFVREHDGATFRGSAQVTTKRFA